MPAQVQPSFISLNLKEALKLKGSSDYQISMVSMK